MSWRAILALRRDGTVWGLLLVQVLVLWLSLGWEALGTRPWHHLASLGGVLVVSALLWRPFARSRRFLALGVLASSVLATVSGFWLLYWKEGIRIDGIQDWGVFWHVVWSWFAAVFFVMHTWINRQAFVHFFRRSVSRVPRAVVHVGAYVVLTVALFVTWGVARDAFTNRNYIPLSLYAWLVVTVPPYVLWALVSARARDGADRLVRRFAHWRVRSVVDLALVPVSVLVVVSGVVLLFFDDLMDAYGWKYVSKFWHVWPSVAFSVLVFVHAVQAWRTVQAHWRAYGVRPVTPGVARAR